MTALIESSESLEIILKITERCNINCTYCYMFNKGNDDYLERPAAISTRWIDDVARFLVEGVERLDAKRVNVVFHGGEPLMLKKRQFRKVCEKLRDAIGSKVQLGFGLQTNAMLIDEDWVEIFAEFDIALGISLDGPAYINDRYRVDKRGRGTHQATIDGMRRLEDAYNAGRIEKPGVICVINPDHSAREIYRHVVDELKIDNISFNLPMETIDTIGEGYSEKYRNFVLDLFEEWTSDDNPNIKIRLFDQMFRYFSGDRRFQNMLSNALTQHVMVVIASDGTLSEHDDFKVINFAQRGGSVADTTLYEFANSPLRRYLHDVHSAVPDDCQDCAWKTYCRAGVTHGLTVTRYSQARGFNNRSSMCAAFSSLFDAGAAYLMRNGLPVEQLRAALVAQAAGVTASGASISAVPKELFS